MKFSDLFSHAECMVSVVFPNSIKKYFYLCSIKGVRKGDLVEVQTNNGIEVVEVVHVSYYTKETTPPFPFEMAKKVIRVVSGFQSDFVERPFGFMQECSDKEIGEEDLCLYEEDISNEITDYDEDGGER